MYNIFEHYLAVEHLYTQTVMPVCEKHELTYMEFTVVMFLANNPLLDTASDIVKCKKITKSHISVSVGALEEKGFLSSEYRDGNRRRLHLKLNEKSKPVIRDGIAAQKKFREILLSDISDEERKTLTEILKRIDNNVTAYSFKEKVRGNG